MIHVTMQERFKLHGSQISHLDFLLLNTFSCFWEKFIGAAIKYSRSLGEKIRLTAKDLS